MGMDGGTPVNEEYGVPFRFTGNIAKVIVDLKETTATAPGRGGRSSEGRKLEEGDWQLMVQPPNPAQRNEPSIK